MRKDRSFADMLWGARAALEALDNKTQDSG
jgi:hypothetical protein